jgi:hypothetical protein
VWQSGGTLYAVDVNAAPGAITFGAHRALFTFPATGTDGTAAGYIYDAARDGRRFLFQLATAKGLTNAMTLVIDRTPLQQ